MKEKLFDSLILSGTDKEIYFEKLGLAIDELNGFLEKKDSEENGFELYKESVIFNEQIRKLYSLYQLTSLENDLKGGSIPVVQINKDTGFPMITELKKLEYQVRNAKENLSSLINNTLEEKHNETGCSINANNFLEELGLKTAETMLEGRYSDVRKKQLRDFIHLSRLVDLENDNSLLKKGYPKDFLKTFLAEEQFTRTYFLDELSEDKVHVINHVRINKENNKLTNTIITFDYVKSSSLFEMPKIGGLFGKKKEKPKKSFEIKGALSDTLESIFENNFSPASAYHMLTQVKGVQPITVRTYTLGPFHTADSRNNSVVLDSLFMNEPDSFILLYSEDIAAKDPEGIEIDGKITCLNYPSNYFVITPSPTGIDFNKLLGEGFNVELHEIKPSKVEEIKNRYENINPRWAKEYNIKKYGEDI